MEKHSQTLFDNIYDEIRSIIESKSDTCLSFEGLWAFLYQKGANSLKSCYHKIENVDLTDEYKESIEKAFVNCDEGSLGDAFKKLEHENQLSLTLPNTFNDARGVVCLTDSIIQQQHAIFYMVKETKNNLTEIFGMFDIFFSNKPSDNGNIEINLKLLKEVIDVLFENKNFKILCISAFNTKRFETLFENNIISGNGNKDKIVADSIGKIEKILSIYSETPIFYIEKKNYPEIFIGINFDFIHSTIKYQYRFCSLINNKPDCPHYCCGSVATVTSCSNPFLKNYFYKTINSLGWELYQFNEIEVLRNRYKIKYWGKNEIDKTKLLQIINTIGIQNQLDKFNRYSNISELAQNKFQDEIIFSNLKREFKSHFDIGALAIERVCKPHIVSKVSCEISIDRKDISPSEISYHLYNNNSNSKFEINQGEAFNTVHIEILSEVLFKNELKKLIQNNKNEYCGYLRNYLIEKDNGYEELNELTFHYLGNNPFNLELINSQINEQTLQIVSVIQKKETENHAIRAAISQCMARTESHNHGSHILNHLTSYSFYSNFNFDKLKQYSSILKIEKKDSINMQEVVDNLFNLKIKALKNVLSNTEEQKKYIEFTESEPFKEFIEDLKKEFICIIKKNSAQNNNTSQENILFKLLATLIDYIRVRMEYIADISFGVPVMVTTRKFYSEVFRSFDENRLLLNFISGIDIDTFKFRINCESKDGVPLNEKNDISVAFPSDMLSQSAFFNIVENILRNTSKHNQDKIDNKEVTFIINIEPIKSEDDFLKVEIYDNIDLGKVDCKTEKDEEKETIREYFNLSSISEIKKIHEVVFNLNSKLNGTILQNNMIRDHALGLMEMEASCCYLRRLDLINIESNEFNLEQPNHYMINEKNRKDGTGNYNILRAFVKELGRGEEKKHCLGYTFFVLKPKDYLFIGFDKDKEIYKIDGVNHLSNNDLENELKVGKSFDHQFVIYKDISVKEILEKYKYQVTHRWIQIDENDEIFKLNDKKNLDDKIWDKWWDMIKGVFSDVNVLNSTNQNEFNIWLVDHSDTAIKTNEEFDKKTTNYQFVELLSTKAKMTLPEYKTNLANYLEEDLIYNGEFCKRIKYKLFESYKSKILILDERVQNIMEKENYMNIDYNRLYPKSNIFVPLKSEINLDEQKFDNNYFQKFNNYTDNIKENVYEIIVIHFSLIERLNFADEDKQNFFKKINTKCRKVVVTSGRGIPKEASRYNVGFINLSSLINAVHLTRSKYLLYSILINTRKINHG